MNLNKLSAYCAAISLTLLAGCGSGGGEGTSRTGLTAVKVMGDSLSDSGVFGGLGVGSGYGRIFSVQASPGVGSDIWTERITALVGAPQLCSYFKAIDTDFTKIGRIFSTQVNCGSFAVGSGLINNRYYQGAPYNLPQYSIPTQIATAASLGNFKSSDLLLIDGGGNDAADLIGAYLGASPAPDGDGGASFVGIVTSTLSPVPAIGIALGTSDLATAGTLYMQTLADEFSDSIKTNALNKGATHIAVLNIPAVTKTPRFQMVLDDVQQRTALAYSSEAAGAGARASVEQLANAWIQAFNARLASNFAGNGKVVVVDFYSAFLDQVAHPSQYGLTNVKDPACPITGLAADGLPKYNFETCTAAALSAMPGKSSPDWWKTYAFSDGFHPTPYGYQLMSQLVARSLAQAGWIQ